MQTKSSHASFTPSQQASPLTGVAVQHSHQAGGHQNVREAGQTGATQTDAGSTPAPDTAMRTGAQIIWETLVLEGVDLVFGYPGGAIMPAYDAMPQYPIHHVLVRHEQGASHMADGYARASGRVGVAVATSGPGATNLVTGIATAMLDSIPIVCITGQVPSTLIGTDAFQEVDMTGITLPITKHNYLVTRAEDIGATIREAFYVARSGRPGPVVVDITKDAQQASCRYVPAPATTSLPGYHPTTTADDTSVGYDAAAALIQSCKKPIVLAGHGVIEAKATDALLAFVERTHIPVACTLLGLGGFPAGHAHALGMMGMHGESWVNEAIQEADLLIAVGMRFDDRVTGNLKNYAKKAKKIHIELDPAEINKNVKVDVAVLGDAKTSLEEITKRVGASDCNAWLDHIARLKGDSSVRDIKHLPDLGKLYAAHVIHDLWNLTKGEAIVVTDVGQHQMWEAQYYKHDFPRRLITSGGLGTMGFALPAAMGAHMAQPEAETWVVVGDGGFQMTACELTTCAQEGLNINIAIINNGFLGMVRQWQQFFYGGRYVATPMLSPDFVKLAEAHGLTGLRVTQRSDVRAAVEEAQRIRGTVVIDFRVEQEDAVYPMVPTGADLQDMIRRPENVGEDKNAVTNAAHNPIFETGQD